VRKPLRNVSGGSACRQNAQIFTESAQQYQASAPPLMTKTWIAHPQMARAPHQSPARAQSHLQQHVQSEIPVKHNHCSCDMIHV
jgi:hypothetical protein